jgi:alcohol dehydrogenase (NADP+)
VHTLNGGWGELTPPVIAGHEIVGIATRVGSQVDTGIKVGDRVGVGAQVGSCYSCKLCKSENENYCPKKVDTYVSGSHPCAFFVSTSSFFSSPYIGFLSW